MASVLLFASGFLLGVIAGIVGLAIWFMGGIGP